MTQPIRPILGELELRQVQLIQLDEDQVLTRHDIPALEGDFYQRLGRRGAAVELTGVLTGPEARAGLNGLRERFRAGEPLTFASDITTATELDRVLIDRFEITERAGHPDCFEYQLRLREFTEAPTPEPEIPPPPPPPPKVEQDEGVLVVNVIVENNPSFDFSQVSVTVTGTTQDGAVIPGRALNDRDGNRWTEDPFPVGTFTVQATAQGASASGEDLSGSAEAPVRAGETTEVTIVLRDEAAVALRFMIHFRFDSAFIEPCLKSVLKQVAEFAADNPGLKLLPVGHTDLAGPTEYNQSLSERRARSTFSMLWFANDRQNAIDEWNELRQRRTPGVFRSLNDSWGAREYQQMLQDRGFYNGRIDGDHGPLTDQAVRDFQSGNGVTPSGVVDAVTWPLLIEAYLAAENLSVADDRFLPNCPGESLKWLGCSELDPLRDTEDAWRPNRRTELLFTSADTLPADIAEPDTFELPTPGAVAADWCLNESGTTTRCCFTERYPNVRPKEVCPNPLPRGEPMTRQAAEASPSFVVKGSIRFEDGSPYANQGYVLTAADGEYMDGEQPRSTANVRAGTPFAGRTDSQGRFQYPAEDKRKTPGIFIIEVDADVVARLDGAPLEEAKGPVVCKRLAGDADCFDVVIVNRTVADVIPRITAPTAVLVRKPHTNPARQAVSLSVNQPFDGNGELTVAEGGGRIRVFDVPAGGIELTFDGTDNVFTSDQLVAGHRLFIDGGPAHSDTVDDVQLRLALTVSGQPGFADTVRLTAVEVTLDITQDRAIPGLDPTPLSQTDKINPGRFLQRQNPRGEARRAMLLVRRAAPEGFEGNLELIAINGRVRLFNEADEQPATSQVPITLPLRITNSSVPATAPAPRQAGAKFWAEGAQASAAVRDAGFQLGIADLEPDGDRVLMTTIDLDITDQNTAAAPTSSRARIGLWDNAFSPTTGALRNGVAEAANFIGSDTRRFFVRVRDASASGEINVLWRTVFGDDSDDDARGVSGTVTLTELASDPHVFVSRALMLVADAVDRAQPTNSGLPAGHPRAGNRGVAQSDHRIRRVTISNAHPLDHKAAVAYTPASAGVAVARASTLLFDRNPEERRRIRIHLVNVRATAGGTGALLNARRTQVIQTIQSIYGICGIFAEIDEIQLDPPASCIGWPTRYTDAIAVDPSVESFSFPGGTNLVPSTSQSDLIAAVRALPGFEANDIYVVFVNRVYGSASAPVPPPTTPPSAGLVAGSRGQSFPDAWVAAGSAARGFTFVGVQGGVTDFTEVHEITHVTTDLRNSAGGHFTLAATNVTDDMNLMRNGTRDGLGVRSTKRLWNTNFTNPALTPSLIPAQIGAIRGSRFVRPF